jgi:DNA-binding NarL/FixJ family response regulator
VNDPRPGQGGPWQEDPQIRVFLLDGHANVRRGIREALTAEPDLDVVGEADTAAAALARIPDLRPAVVILDARLGGGHGISACRDIRSAAPRSVCLMLTSFGDDDALFDAIMAGAAGYVLKQVRGTDLAGAVRAVATGQSLLDPVATGRVLHRARSAAARSGPLTALTEQDRHLLELITAGLTNRQIGAQLRLAEKAVKRAVASLFAKLGLDRRTEGAATAARLLGGKADGQLGGSGQIITSV